MCIDDGSTDNSLEILKNYRHKYSRIIIIEQQNSGPAVARNNGLKKAIGEYVAFMDPDDYYPSNTILELLYDKAVEHNVMICGGSMCRVINNKIYTDFGYQHQYLVFTENKKINYFDYQFDCGYTRFIYSKKMLVENNIWFPDYRRFQDPPFFVRAMICAKEFYAVKDITYCYRKDRRRKKYSAKMINDTLRGLTDNLVISKENGLEKLHRITVKSLCDNYMPYIFDNISKNNKEMMSLLLKANDAIDSKMLDDNDDFIRNGYIITL